MGPIPIRLVSLKKDQDTDTYAQKKDHVKTERQRRWPPANQREKSSEEASSANTLISDFQPPEQRENKFLLFKSPSLWYFVSKLIQNIITK